MLRSKGILLQGCNSRGTQQTTFLCSPHPAFPPTVPSEGRALPASGDCPKASEFVFQVGLKALSAARLEHMEQVLECSGLVPFAKEC